MFDRFRKLVGRETITEKREREAREREVREAREKAEREARAVREAGAEREREERQAQSKLNWQSQMRSWQSSFTFDQRTRPKALQTLSAHCDDVNSLMLLSDGRLASSGRDDSNIKLWDVDRGECVSTLSGHSRSAHALTLLLDGRLARGSHKVIELWDVERGECVSTLEGHRGSVDSLTLLSDGRLASGGYKVIKLWDVERGECVSMLKGHSSRVVSLTLLSDGRLASGGDDKRIKLWDVERGECVSTLLGHFDHVYSLTLLSDGRLASGSADSTIKLWDVDRGECVSTLSGHSSWVYCVTLLSDGRLASGSSDHSIKLWDVERGESVATLLGHSSSVLSLMLLPDGRLASGSYKEIKLWDVGLRPKTGLFLAAKLNPCERGLLAERERAEAAQRERKREEMERLAKEKAEQERKAREARKKEAQEKREQEEKERIIKEKAEQERKAREAREKAESERQERIRQEKEAQERQRAEEARCIKAAVDTCQELRSRWRVDAVEVLCDRYASMIEAMPEVSALTVERAAYFEFLAERSSELDQQITWYEKALDDCDKALGIDKSNVQAETEKARLSKLLAPLVQEKTQRDEKKAALSSLHEQWQTLDPKQLLNEYQTLIDQHPEDSDYYKAQGEYYVFCGEKAKLMAQKSNFYKKATSVFESVLEKDCFDEAAATRIEEISLMLSDLSQTSSSSSGNASNKAPNKGLHIDRLGIEGSHCIEESELAFLSVLGKGGFGEVKLARWGGNKPVAVKKCLTDCDKDAVEEVGRLNDEAVIMKSLDHPGILKLLGFLTVTNHLQGIVLEYCPQGTLHDFIKKHSSNITKQLRLSFAIDLCEAIAYLHSRDPHIVHKDLNSRNVLLTEGTQIKVADFGISAVREEKTKKTAHTQNIAGTTRYMAPELFENHQANTASDVWAMGMVLFEIFTNDVPYSDYSAASNMMALMLHIRDKNLPHIPTDYAEEYPQQMASINKCWATNWQDRAEAKTISLDFREIQSAEGNTGDVSVSFDEFTL